MVADNKCDRGTTIGHMSLGSWCESRMPAISAANESGAALGVGGVVGDAVMDGY